MPGPPTAPGGSRPYTDPKAPTIGEASFLVEDYVPERLDVTLSSATPDPDQG